MLTVFGTAAFAAKAAPIGGAPSALVGFQANDDGDDGGAGGGKGRRPANIHTGTCVSLDPNPAFPLTNVAPRGAGDDDDVEESESGVGASLDDILAQPYAINVRAGNGDPNAFVACGDVTGQVVDGKLVVGLRQVGGAGLAGIAVLEDDDDDGQAEVTVYLTRYDVVSAPAGGVPAGTGSGIGTGGGDDDDDGGDD